MKQVGGRVIVANKESRELVFSAILRFCLVGSVSVRGGSADYLNGYQGHACQPSQGPPPQWL